LGGFQRGRLTSSGNGYRREIDQYDERGRVTAAWHALAGGSYAFTTQYGYPTPSGVRGGGSVVVGSTFPDGERVDYGYDNAGAEQSVIGAGQVVVSRIGRNARGQATSVEYGDGTTTTHSYDDGGDLRLRQTITRAAARVLQAYAYRFDAQGNITELADFCDQPASASQVDVRCCDPSLAQSCTQDLTADYAYDSLDQLIQMSSPLRRFATLAYGYDAAGNLTNKEGQAQTYGGSGKPHALASAGGTHFSYDENGNAIVAGATTISWNPENMPVHLVSGTSRIEKSFVGETLWKQVDSSGVTYYLPSVRAEAGGPKLRKFYSSFAERDPSDGALKFYHSDQLGSSTLVTQAGAPIHRAAYYPYGEDPGGRERFASTSQPFDPKYKFTFKEKQAIACLYDYGARLYDSCIGRFLSADTSAQDGYNRYAYVRNNPLVRRDPTGHASWRERWDRLKTNVDEFITGMAMASAIARQAELQSGPGVLLYQTAAGRRAVAVNAEVTAYWMAHQNDTSARAAGGKALPAIGVAAGVVAAGAALLPVPVEAPEPPRARLTPAQIAAKTEQQWQNQCYGTCLMAAMQNLIRAQTNGYRGSTAILEGELTTPGVGYLKAGEPVLIHLGRATHAMTLILDDEQMPHFLSWGNAHPMPQEAVGMDNVRLRGTFSDPGLLLQYMLKERIDPPMPPK
jgi:RHS repeat-associated protein